MKFVKGMVLGSIVTAGTMMMYAEGAYASKKMMMKKGKEIAKKVRAIL